MRILFYALFFVVNLAIGIGLHYYLFVRLLRDPGWPPHWVLTGRIALAVLGFSIPIAFLLSRVVPRAVATPLVGVAFVWMGSVFLTFLFVLGADLVRWLFTSYQSVAGAPLDAERRQMIARGAAAVVASGGAAATALSLKGGLGEVEVKEVEIKLERLPKALDGLTLVQLTDVHIGPTIGDRFVRAIVEKSNALRPDAILVTGDLVDGPLHTLGAHAQALGRLKARYGQYFVTGNHEFYSGVDPWLEELERLGLVTLGNRRVRIGDAASIDLAGVHDASAGRFGSRHRPDVAAACAGRDPDRALVLMAHQPKAIFDAAKAGVDLQISGHTHGGQIFPFTAAVALVQPYVAGLARHDERTQIYVSRGTGYWGPPMRLLAPSEITKIVLTSG